LGQKVLQKHSTHQVVVDTFVKLPLSLPALPELMVIIIETLPVLAEFIQTVLVDIFDAKLRRPHSQHPVT